MQVGVLTQLRDSLCFALALTNDDAREVLVIALLVLRFVGSRPSVAACLVARWLFDLSL